MLREEIELKIKELNSYVIYIWNGWRYLKLRVRELIYGTHGFRDEDDVYTVMYYDDIKLITTKVPLVIAEKVSKLGSDPELFFVKDGKVVPSTLVVPPDNDNQVTQDGFQGELNPSSSNCRQTAASNIGAALEAARIYARNVGADLSFDVGQIISDDVWKSVPPSLKRYGCNPTLNVHERKFVRVTGMRERFRAAGGHIHLGIGAKDNLPQLVELMDIIAGNTCVLIDLDPNNARRRKNYGRAGEYRVKPYGLEYRVLSNFWLKSPILWSFASGLVREAYEIQRLGIAEELLSRFNMKDIRDAINNNDKELALSNFKILLDFFKEKRLVSRACLSYERNDKILKWVSSADPLSYAVAGSITGIMNEWECAQDAGFESFIEDINL
jgi:hypothetical protein